MLCRGSARAEQFSADQSPEAPPSWYLRRAEAVGFEPTGVLPPLVFKTSAFVRSAIPPNGSWDYIRENTTRSYNVRAKRLLWYAPSPTTTGGRGATTRLATLPRVWYSARNPSTAARPASNSSIAHSSKGSNYGVCTLARVKDRVVLSVSQDSVQRFSNRTLIQLVQDGGTLGRGAA